MLLWLEHVCYDWNMFAMKRTGAMTGTCAMTMKRDAMTGTCLLWLEHVCYDWDMCYDWDRCAINMSILLARFRPSSFSRLTSLELPPCSHHLGSVTADDEWAAILVSCDLSCDLTNNCWPLLGPLRNVRILEKKTNSTLSTQGETTLICVLSRRNESLMTCNGFLSRAENIEKCQNFCY